MVNAYFILNLNTYTSMCKHNPVKFIFIPPKGGFFIYQIFLLYVFYAMLLMKKVALSF